MDARTQQQLPLLQGKPMSQIFNIGLIRIFNAHTLFRKVPFHDNLVKNRENDGVLNVSYSSPPSFSTREVMTRSMRPQSFASSAVMKLSRSSARSTSS